MKHTGKILGLILLIVIIVGCFVLYQKTTPRYQGTITNVYVSNTGDEDSAIYVYTIQTPRGQFFTAGESCNTWQLGQQVLWSYSYADLDYPVAIVSPLPSGCLAK